MALVFTSNALAEEAKPSEKPQSARAARYLPEEEMAAIRGAAEKGDLKAQFKLSRILYDGKQAPMNLKEAAKWAQKSAEAGDENAQVLTAVFYGAGIGFEPDIKKTEQWVRKAVSKGNPLAQASMGYLYGQGVGVKLDYKEAFMWLEKSGKAGNPVGQVGLGKAYSDGLGVQKDMIKGYMWLELAAQSTVEAIKAPQKGDWSDMPGILYSKGLLLDNILSMKSQTGQLMSKAQMEKAEKLAAEWRKSRK